MENLPGGKSASPLLVKKDAVLLFLHPTPLQQPSENDIHQRNE